MATLHNAEASIRYRQRAEELRTIALAMADSNTKKIILSIAVEYDRMAQSVTELEGGPSRPEPPSDENPKAP